LLACARRRQKQEGIAAGRRMSDRSFLAFFGLAVINYQGGFFTHFGSELRPGIKET
jgi:hypothetical protein